MKVFDLFCTHGHRFEGWFGSRDDFDMQQKQGFLRCPVCDSDIVHKALSAPRLNLAATETAIAADCKKTVSVERAESTSSSNAIQPDVERVYLEVLNHVLSASEDVGEQFAQEARKIYYGEAPERVIRGYATSQEREALSDEGIDTISISFPSVHQRVVH